MATARLDIAYHGAGFAGWAAQPGLRTVQGDLEEALARILGASVALTVAGRTDAGVHASGQVASVNLESDLAADAVMRALNVRLPVDIRVLAVEDVRPGFHARFDAKGKSYRYRMVTTPVMSPFGSCGRSTSLPVACS